MTDYFTKVEGGGYLCRGQLSRAEALAETRRFAEYHRAKYAAICEHLSKPDAELTVSVVRGSVREKLIRELLP